MNVLQFTVLEHCDEFEQFLRLRCDDKTPELGVLDWRGKSDPGAIFVTRAAARAAITRTEHYRKAFGLGETLPLAKNCKIVPVRLVQS